MWIMKWLGLGKAEREQAMPTSEAFGKLLRVLNGIDADNHAQARYLAAFACLLGRVAYADGFISSVEQASMKRMLSAHSSLNFMQVDLVLDIARFETVTNKGAPDPSVSGVFAAMADEAQRRELVDCLFALAAADEIIHPSEWKAVETIAAEVGVDPAVVAEIGAGYAKFRP